MITEATPYSLQDANKAPFLPASVPLYSPSWETITVMPSTTEPSATMMVGTAAHPR